MNGRSWCVVGMLTLAVVGLGFVPPVLAADEFKIGVITSLSGDLATGGSVTKRGYDLWAKAVNAQGGIEIKGKKYPVRLVYGDDQSQPAQAASAAERLAAQEKVDAILGPYASGTTLSAAPVLEKYKVPMITGSAESPLIWKQKFRYTFGTIPPVNFTGATVIKVLAALPQGPKTAVIYGSNDTFSKATAEAFQATAEQVGIKVLRFNILPPKQDMTPLMSAAKVLNPDLIAFGGHDEELVNLVKVLTQINFTPKALLMHYGVTEPAFAQALGKNANQVLGASVWTGSMQTKGSLGWPTAKAYFEAAVAEYPKDPPDYTQAASSAAGLVFQAALTQLGSAPPLNEAARTNLVEILEKLDLQTFYGRVKFAAEGDYYHSNAGLTPLMVQITGGKEAVVAPPESAQAKLVYPMTPWDKR
ncbi:MAG TPA: amino acid ABC transporter substrate-binding protein [Candidatus Methylomirabilis sp.]|nr:amino acid ABC transporter substrate-binding protein [Candidatus Methylomirabilis sp.]